MGSQYQVISLVKMVGIVFHKTIAPRQPCGHDFHATYQCSGLPVAFSGESISFCHQSLDCDARELQITPGAPMLLVERTSFLSTSEPVEFLVDRRVPDFSFMVWLRRK